MAQTCDILIVGGGVIGTSIASRPRRRRGRPRRAAGKVVPRRRLQRQVRAPSSASTTPTASPRRMAQQSLRVFEHFHDLVGGPPGLHAHRHGPRRQRTRPRRPGGQPRDAAASWASTCAWSRRRSWPTSTPTPASARTRWRPSRREAGYVEAVQVVASFADAARRAGCRHPPGRRGHGPSSSRAIASSAWRRTRAATAVRHTSSSPRGRGRRSSDEQLAAQAAGAGVPHAGGAVPPAARLRPARHDLRRLRAGHLLQADARRHDPRRQPGGRGDTRPRRSRPLQRGRRRRLAAAGPPAAQPPLSRRCTAATAAAATGRSTASRPTGTRSSTACRAWRGVLRGRLQRPRLQDVAGRRPADGRAGRGRPGDARSTSPRCGWRASRRTTRSRRRILMA